MKARTTDGSWYPFSICDIPAVINNKHFVLLNKPNSPILCRGKIIRGEETTELFEGDLILMDDKTYMVCYERGFYAINNDYVIKYLFDLHDYTVIGNCFDDGFDVPIKLRDKHLFKYQGDLFRFEDIVGKTNDGELIIRKFKSPLKIEDIRQECCIAKFKTRLYLGDKLNGGTIFMNKGRVVLDTDPNTDLATGGKIL